MAFFRTSISLNIRPGKDHYRATAGHRQLAGRPPCDPTKTIGPWSEVCFAAASPESACQWLRSAGRQPRNHENKVGPFREPGDRPAFFLCAGACLPAVCQGWRLWVVSNLSSYRDYGLGQAVGLNFRSPMCVRVSKWVSRIWRSRHGERSCILNFEVWKDQKLRFGR